MTLRVATGALLTLAATVWPASAWTQPTQTQPQPPQGAASTAAPPAPPPVAPPPASAAWEPDNRVTLGGDWATLTGTRGGEGGNIGYLQQFTPHTSVGIGAEYQRLASAWWAFGSLNGAYSHALTDHSTWDFHADAHEGRGESNHRFFGYDIAGAGLGVAVPGGVSLDAEDRWLDVDSSRGFLPKLTLAKSWNTHWLTTLAYARSYTGNLNTSYGLARVDFYGRGFNLLAGGDVGRVAPAVLNIDGVLRAEARNFTEVFAGIGKTISRVDLTLLGDRIDLLGIKHLTVTLDLTIHVR
jgi:hypothetical protein